MKDYRLSEIKNHNWNELWDLNDDIAKRRLEFEFLRKAQYSLEHLDIEPRDMIELPYKEQGIDEFGKIWYVYYRSHYLIINSSFRNEEKADEFLAELKEDEQCK